MADPQLAERQHGRYELLAHVLSITTTGSFESDWIPVFLMAPLNITAAGVFTGSITAIGATSRTRPILDNASYPTLTPTLSAKGTISATIPYMWVKVFGSMSALTSSSVEIDCAGFTGVEARG